MSLARRHRERMAAQLAAATAVGPAAVLAAATAGAGGEDKSLPIGGHDRTVDPVVAQIRMRFAADLRRLKEIQSVEKKIEAKREMLPEYRAWCEGLMKQAADTGTGVADEILPTMMVWSIDTGDYDGALQLAEHVLRYGLPMPGRYQRTAATLIVEEIADAALRALGKNEAFEIEILNRVNELTTDHDIFDEVRAKLKKAIGLELTARADATADPNEAFVLRVNARDALIRARDLHERCGVTKAIEKLDRALRAANESNPG